MIEHISYLEGLSLPRETWRILKPGATVRIATPDLRKLLGLYDRDKDVLARQYVEWSLTENLGLYSPNRTTFQERRPEWDIDHQHFLKYHPDLDNDGIGFIVNNFFRSYGHQFLYDGRTLKAAMESVGFDRVRRFSPGESDERMLQGIEKHGVRIGDNNNRFETLILEGVRLPDGLATPPCPKSTDLDV
jgi:hypothetical protein